MVAAFEKIRSLLPYAEPFLFVDELTRVDDDGAEGHYTFKPESDFYKGHFKDYPVTPGVILTETMAQIGLVCLGIYLLNQNLNKNTTIALTSTNIEFLKAVYPGDKVRVVSTKKYFRFGKLKCDVVMYNSAGDAVCEGSIAGILHNPEA